MVKNLFVSVEPKTNELSTSHSPGKVYTPLLTSSPKSSAVPDTNSSPITAPLQIREEISIEKETSNDISIQQSATPNTSQELVEEGNPTPPPVNPESEVTSTEGMEGSFSNISREIVDEFIDQEPPQTLSSHTDPYSSQIAGPSQPTAVTHRADQNVPHSSALPMMFPSEQVGFSGVIVPGAGHGNISVTKREILTISSFLGRIPPEYVLGDETGPEQPLTLTIVDDMETAPMVGTSSQEEVISHDQARAHSDELQEEHVIASGKRRRPRYSLTGAMLRKHPFLKFSATGPIDRDKTPHKWWCRVCRVELSLMSRGSLELLSHYKSETHLVKEHRMRMEIPGMALFDKEGREMYGIQLQEAKKKAKNNYPIAPQLDSCHPLVGQDTIPNFNTVTNPTDKVLSQICILEHGLRHGGHVKSLIGIYGELSRLTSSDGACELNWSQQRLFVSIIFFD